jgi:hypothetical protein
MNKLKRVTVKHNDKVYKYIYLNSNTEVFIYKLKNLALRVGFIAFASYTVFTMGQSLPSSKHIAYAESNQQVTVIDKTLPPILQKICHAESPTGHNKPNGTIAHYVNTNKTIDIGKCQINSIWEAKAVELGYNIYTEQGNEDMALWIFNNYGSEPWFSSKTKWQ